MHIAVSFDTLTDMLPAETRTVSRAMHPCELVTVRIYLVVPFAVGVTVGFDLVALSKFMVGRHRYVLPASAGAPSSADTPRQTVLSVPASALGFGKISAYRSVESVPFTLLTFSHTLFDPD